MLFRSLGRMKEVSGSAGRTVLSVSHNLAAVSALCSRVVLLNKGRLIADGPTAEVLSQYHGSYQRSEEQYRVKTAAITWLGLANRRALDELRLDADIVFEFKFLTGPDAIDNLEVDCELIDEFDRCAVHCRSRFSSPPMAVAAGTEITVRYLLRSPRLAPGNYTMVVQARTASETLCRVEGVDACSISGENPFVRGTFLEGMSGTTLPHFQVSVVS